MVIIMMVVTLGGSRLVLETRLNHVKLYMSSAYSSLVVGWMDRKGR